jgi:two-component system chemotaxis response regulator CheB
MATHDIIVIGGSAGGLAPLQALVKALPEGLPAAVFVVLHLAPYCRSYLSKILDGKGGLPVADAADGEPIVPERIYVAPPDLHLLIEPGYVRVTHGPTENRFRPAVDPLFRSAAHAYGRRVVGVVLSGALNDGTAGLWAIKYRGGIAMVQEPEEALYGSMPMSAIENVEIDHRLRLAEMAPHLVRLAGQEVKEGGDEPTKTMEIETRIAMGVGAKEAGVLELGEPSLFTCPECSGTLLRVREEPFVRFRCHTGHGFTADSLLAEVDREIEDQVWRTQRLIDEKSLLLRETGERTHVRGDEALARVYLQRAHEAHESARVLQDLLQKHRHLSRARLEEGEENRGR